MNAFSLKRINKHKLKKQLLGTHVEKGLIQKAIIYFLLIVIGFVFIYPFLYMFSISMMSNIDLVDNTVSWIPTSFYLENYLLTARALKLPTAYLTSIYIAGSSTIAVAISSAFVGYGLARFQFKHKGIIFGIMIFIFIMPKALFFIPTYQIYTSLRIKGTIWAILAPALTGQGLQGPFFILIFYQFFKMIPKQLEEAAKIDGANAFQVFIRIAIPMAIPAFIITAVYGFSLYWSETFLLGSYLDGKYITVNMYLNNLQNQYAEVINNTGLDSSRNPLLNFSEAKLFAGTLLSIIPMIIFYLIMQKGFLASIDKSGIAGE